MDSKIHCRVKYRCYINTDIDRDIDRDIDTEKLGRPLMLDAFIIDHIRREKERRIDDRPSLQIEVPPYRPDAEPQQPKRQDEDRGIIEIDFTI